jgi:hypothetical protein
LKFAGNRIKTAFDSIINISRVKPTFYTQYQNYSLKCSLKLCFQKSIQALLYNYLAESYDCILLYMAESCDCILLYMAMSCDCILLYMAMSCDCILLYMAMSCDCIMLYMAMSCYYTVVYGSHVTVYYCINIHIPPLV